MSLNPKKNGRLQDSRKNLNMAKSLLKIGVISVEDQVINPDER